jgi:beta-lactamase regulating signal transducer with metallopeptidase domain
MTVWLLLPLALSAVFGALAPTLARRLPPATATWLLSGGAAMAAVASSATVALLGLFFLAQSPLLSSQGRWSNHVLRLHAHQAQLLGAAAVAAALIVAARFTRAATRRLVAVRDAYRLAATLSGTHSELVVLEAPTRQALAVPGRPGRIVATSALLRSLDASQRRALLAHERAHLAHRHHLHQSVGALAAALNPLLARVPPALERSCERWADEDAAHECPRSAVAAALTRAATSSRPTAPAVVLAAGAADVAERIGALHQPAPRLALWRVVVLIGLLAATAAAVAVAMHDTEHLFELAQAAYQRTRR